MLKPPLYFEQFRDQIPLALQGIGNDVSFQKEIMDYLESEAETLIPAMREYFEDYDAGEFTPGDAEPQDG